MPQPSDRLFGELHSTPGAERGTFDWVAYGHFPPTGEAIEYQFIASKDGPLEGQRDLLMRIHARWAQLLPKLIPPLRDYVLKQAEAAAARSASPEFRLVAIWLPSRDEVTMEWDLTFEEDGTGERWMVDMRGWEPVGVAAA